ncbi:hypothetical protein GJU39_19695 [Pedobacter petrophilus]|uniref:Streptomycin biosynthesis protein StrF domain-containing protein n=2 Tax=Pedobacter TaxID=84567 RepID=A0A7K0G4D1_9SPHI|nr:glycosyltransferase [Pedobacter petrophilus]MRX78310.1 hypothetical protein [Pedobacter petrophilus]
MISLIIASANPEYLKKLKDNIAQTIGVQYELLITDNKNQKKGLSQMYNEAASLAKFELLCFMHEDIEYMTYGWGRILIDTFASRTIGLLGVAGSTYKSLTPSMWVADGILGDPVRVNMIQHFKYTSVSPIQHRINPLKEQLSQVTTIDGVWMCMPRYVFEQHRFDEELLPGFHGYDLDLSLQIVGSYPIYVTHEILISHFSEGNPGRDWMDTILKVHQKHLAKLPLNYAKLPQPIMRTSEKNALKVLLLDLRRLGYSLPFRLAIMHRFKFYKVLSVIEFIKFYHKILFNKLVQKKTGNYKISNEAIPNEIIC